MPLRARAGRKKGRALDIQTGISIVMNRWLAVKSGELILLVTDEAHTRELEAFDRWARGQDAVLKAVVLDSVAVQEGTVIDEMAALLKSADVIIGATDSSFITARPVADAVARGARFLSLPLSCADGGSLLESEFIGMNPAWSRRMALKLMHPLNRCDTIRVTTPRGTALTFRKRGRAAGFYCGRAEKRGSVSSASFEAYVPIEEDQTEGRLVLDGSLGYLGLVREPMEIAFRGGVLHFDGASPDGRRLSAYLASFRSENMRRAAEFGIGLNRVSRCRGVSYIEDESAYRTFHIGLGRNLSMGGRQDADGHFDIVTHRPTIYAGDTLIMRDGEIV